MDTIRLGLIGCGGMMRSHAQGLQKVDGLTISAVCDIDLAKAQDVASVLSNPHVTTDYRTMVEHVDAVLVVLPHDLHYECGLFFARNKKHIMMEKPLCNTEEECLRLIKVTEEEGVTLMCAYPMRYVPGVQKLKALLDSGEYGQPFMMSIWTEQLTEYDELHWAQTARIGGGQFFSHGCHYVDLMLWFLGEPVKGSHFGTNLGTPWILREGTSAATIHFKSGAIGYHGATWGARGTRLGYDFQVHTEKGMLHYDHDKREIRLYDQIGVHIPGQEGNHQYTLLWKEEGDYSKQTQFEIRHFLDCIRTGAKPVTDGYAALQGLRCIWKMYDAEKHNMIADLRGLGLEQAGEVKESIC